MSSELKKLREERKIIKTEFDKVKKNGIKSKEKRKLAIQRQKDSIAEQKKIREKLQAESDKTNENIEKTKDETKLAIQRKIEYVHK